MKHERSDDTTPPSPKKQKSVFGPGECKIHVRVGTGVNVKSFSIHKDILRRTSTFFEKATSRWWFSVGEQIIKIPSQRPTHFQIYYDWLYNRSLNMSAEAGKHTLSAVDGADPKLRFLVDCWLLGDYLGDSSFKNKVMRGILSLKIDQWVKIGHETVQKIIERCPASSGVRLWLVHTLLVLPSSTECQEQARQWPHEFLVQLFIEQQKSDKSASGGPQIPTPKQSKLYE